MSNEILVIGATGKVGRHVTAALQARGEPVRPAGRAIPGGVQFDWDRPQTWPAALAGVQRAYLIPPQGTVQPDEQLGGFLAEAAAAGLRRVVLLSALGVDQAEGTGMRAAEKLVESSGLDWTVLRPNWFLQNFSEGFLSPAGRQQLAAPAGSAAVSFIDTRDIAEAAAVTLTTGGHGGQGYTLTGPQARTFAEVAAAISRVSGHRVEYVDRSPEQTRPDLLAAGLSEPYAEMLLSLFAGVRAGWNAGVTGTLPELLGRPGRSLDDYVQDHAAAWAG